jgi:two-component system, NtrC family, response regulator GlrR
MPPLRDRPEDIPLLAELFLSRATAQHGLSRPHLAHDALHLLMSHDWPGNIRELANVVQGAALLSPDGVLRPPHVRAVLPRRAGDAPDPDATEGAQAVAPRVAQVLDSKTPLPPSAKPGKPSIVPTSRKPSDAPVAT